jgi:CheY-like chemotaxis protein
MGGGPSHDVSKGLETNGTERTDVRPVVTLVAEDEPAVRNLVRILLEREGHRLLITADGQEALDLARSYQGQIHLLVTDIVMPRLHGDELAATLLKERPGIRVLLMSGKLAQEPITAEMRLAFLRKPFALTEFTAAIRQVLTAQPRL